jgi:hypothetical protein
MPCSPIRPHGALARFWHFDITFAVDGVTGLTIDQRGFIMAEVNEYRLRLHVAGGTSAVDRAITALRRLARVVAYGVHSEVVNVLFHAELFLDMGGEPLPMLVRIAPEPVRALQGSIANPEQIARVLTLE